MKKLKHKLQLIYFLLKLTNIYIKSSMLVKWNILKIKCLCLSTYPAEVAGA